MGKYSTPMADFLARIEYHAANIEGRILRGFKWDVSVNGGLNVPTMAAEGLTDLPGLRLYLPEIRESFRPARHTDGTISFKLLVATARRDGIINLVASVEKVVDALQLTAEATPRLKALAGTVQHFDWQMTDPFILDNSINAQLTISARPSVGEVGNRR